jgi:hypothetical protein
VTTAQDAVSCLYRIYKEFVQRSNFADFDDKRASPVIDFVYHL